MQDKEMRVLGHPKRPETPELLSCSFSWRLKKSVLSWVPYDIYKTSSHRVRGHKNHVDIDELQTH